MKPARLIMMGNAALAQGFALIGFEVWPDAQIAQLDELLLELVQKDQTALVFLEAYLAQSGSKIMHQLQQQGRQIMITEIPPLSDPQAYCPEVESLLAEVFGKTILD